MNKDSDQKSLLKIYKIFSETNHVKEEIIEKDLPQIDKSVLSKNIKTYKTTNDIIPIIAGIKLKQYPGSLFMGNTSNERTKIAMYIYGGEKLMRSKSLSSKGAANKSFNYLPKRINYNNYSNNPNISVIQERIREKLVHDSRKYSPILISRFSTRQGIKKYNNGLNNNVSFVNYNPHASNTKTGLKYDLYGKYPRMF